MYPIVRHLKNNSKKKKAQAKVVKCAKTNVGSIGTPLGHLSVILHFPPAGTNLWSPFKELYITVNAALSNKLPDAYYELENVLRKHKPDFISLLQNPVSCILKGIFSDSNNIFLWHESEDIYKHIKLTSTVSVDSKFLFSSYA